MWSADLFLIKKRKSSQLNCVFVCESALPCAVLALVWIAAYVVEFFVIIMLLEETIRQDSFTWNVFMFDLSRFTLR